MYWTQRGEDRSEKNAHIPCARHDTPANWPMGGVHEPGGMQRGHMILAAAFCQEVGQIPPVLGAAAMRSGREAQTTTPAMH